ncbi:type II secretion system F family protein [Ornithinimicrobium cryptoxanthini]|uniref:Type II secretion system F family protein n=1 Tax=Ornithinimicrobium cryptoxanthini TaxID=2934161 RepID=A0ABY4YL76_9MICO|nr:type II secretion system F family protein [Ornithinimicrobium cryptoxanthini]USQ77468.1 type II secretion system F family protein [Ornithinimicrobium cryptoxanthini]
MSWDTLVAGSNGVWLAAGALVLAVAIAAYVFIVPSHAIPMDRRRYGVQSTPSLITQATDASTGLIDRLVRRRRGGADSASHALDLAGIKRSVPEFILLVGAAALTGAALGLVIGGLIVAIMLACLAVAGALVFVSFRANRRRANFADQLDDLVQLLGSNMRAGHSVLQAMDSVAREMEEPGSSEIARVVNQVRVGRDLGEALDETADRMDSDDFRWISQAIAIHRQVGGNLAEVMDTVGETIRERNQIRRQVSALSAEGKLSAYVLIALPVGVTLMLLILNPEYILGLTQSPIGYALILLAMVLMTVGSVWLSKIVKIKF